MVVLSSTSGPIVRLSWKYIPVVMLSSAMMLAWAVLWLNLNRRSYPTWWLYPAEELRKIAFPGSELGAYWRRYKSYRKQRKSFVFNRAFNGQDTGITKPQSRMIGPSKDEHPTKGERAPPRGESATAMVGVIRPHGPPSQTLHLLFLRQRIFSLNKCRRGRTHNRAWPGELGAAGISEWPGPDAFILAWSASCDITSYRY